MTVLGNTFSIGDAAISYGTVLMLALYALVWFALRNTAPGRHVYAVGNDPEAARLNGIATGRVLLGVYAVAGLMYGIASLLVVARTGVGDPQAGQTEALDAITAVVLGGTSLFGGRGVVLGHADRCADRRRVPKRPDPDGRLVDVPDPDHRHPGDSCGRRRPAFAPQER